jgi:DNA-binding MarR family transcriptional regulator
MSNKAITWAYAQKDLKAGPKFVLVTLADMADQEHSCYPGVDTLADLTGFGATAVRGHIDALIARGLIETERRHKRNGARTSDRYYLQLTPAEEKAVDVDADSEGTPDSPNAGKRADLASDFERRNAGFRRAYKDEPSVEPKGEPSDQSLEGFDLVVIGPSAKATFDEFWAAYPRHVAKTPAEAKFRKAVERTDPRLIIEGARRYAESVAGRDPQHIAHPTTWLNQERWTDEIPVAATRQAGPATIRQRAESVHEKLLRREAERQQADAPREITA